MAESQSEQLLFRMILNLSSAFGEMQEALLTLTDHAQMEEAQKAEMVRHTEAAAVQFMDLLERAKEYQALVQPRN